MNNDLLAIVPADFAAYGKAWIEAVSLVLNMGIAQFGVLALAILAVRQNIRSRLLQEQIEEAKARLDRQGARLDMVALSVPATPAVAAVKIEQPADQPIPVKETTTGS